MTVHVSVNIDTTRPLAELAPLVRDLEAAGVDLIWVAEAYGREAVAQLGYLAAITDRVQLGSAVLNVFSRTPTLLAQSAMTVDELSSGRFVLGLGTSGPQVIEGWHGLPYRRPIGRTLDVIDICRAVWRRERIDVHGRTLDIPLDPSSGTGYGKALKISTPPTRPDIPIWVAALGDRNVELTAAHADGWLPFLFVPERADAVWGAALEKGRAQRDATLGPLAICAGGHFAIVEDDAGIRAARDRARPALAHYLGGMGARDENYYNRLARRAGFERDAAVAQDLYLSGRRDEAAAALSDEIVEATTICGPRSYVAERLAAYQQAGVTHLKLRGASDDVVAEVAQVKELLG